MLTVDPLKWKSLSVTYQRVGRLDTASALLAAVDNHYTLLTEEPGQYPGPTGGVRIIAI